jgi:hypothetical protein
LRQGVTRVIGSLLGLGLITYRRLNSGGAAANDSGIAAWIAGIINLLQGLPPVRDGLQRLMDRNAVDLVMSGLPALAVGPRFDGRAGAEFSGGPFVLELQEGKPFAHHPRPALPTPALYEHYHRIGPQCRWH